MPKTLLIAEKPSVARDIARVLRVNQKGEGYLQSDTMIVSWAIGHLARLAEPDELSPEWKRWSMDALPMIPSEWAVMPISKTHSQLAVLKRLMKSKDVDRLICATDAGREGELIFRWIYQLAGCKKPVDRLWISSMTDEAIKEGMAALKPDTAYDPLFQSALCRAQADWLVGMNMSRAFTVREGVLLSIGRVQTPTLALLVRRKHEIDAFVPTTTFTAEADFGAYQGTWFDKDAPKGEDASSLPTREAAQRIADAAAGQTGVVKSCKQSTQKEQPPQMFDLTTLQREANRRYGFTAKKTLSVAQELYEKHKLITYPRTDCRYLPFDVRPKVEKALNALPEPYTPLVPTALAGMGAMKAGRVFRQNIESDHHAIIPTGKAYSPERLPSDAQKLMDMIARRLISAFYPAYEAARQEIVTDVCGMLFQTVQKTTAQLGYKLVEGKKDDLPPLANVSVGERYDVKKTGVKEHVSKPPVPYTDATILGAMENAGKLVEDEQLKETMKKHGLGTPATRAAILERLVDVGYATRSGKSLLPTDKGVKLIGCVPEQLASAELTGKWEYGLNLIAEQKSADDALASRFLQGVQRMTAELVDAVKAAPSAAFEPESRAPRRGRARKAPAMNAIEGICPVCGKGRVCENERAFGCSRWKQGCEMTIWKDALSRHGGPVLNRAIVERLLKDGMVRGSTGVITLSGTSLRFSFANTAEATPPISIIYHKDGAKSSEKSAAGARKRATTAGRRTTKG